MPPDSQATEVQLKSNRALVSEGMRRNVWDCLTLQAPHSLVGKETCHWRGISSDTNGHLQPTSTTREDELSPLQVLKDTLAPFFQLRGRALRPNSDWSMNRTRRTLYFLHLCVHISFHLLLVFERAKENCCASQSIYAPQTLMWN